MSDNPEWDWSILSGTLRRAADALEALPHARVNRVDLHLAMRKAACTTRTAQEALDKLAEHLNATGEARWLHCWATARGRDEVAGWLRAAAERVPTPITVLAAPEGVL